MAVTSFAFTSVDDRGIPAVIVEATVTEEKTPSGSNQATTAAATASRRMCRVSTDTAVYVSFGAAPNAVTDTGQRFYIPAGAIDAFFIDSGDKAAVVTA